VWKSSFPPDTGSSLSKDRNLGFVQHKYADNAKANIKAEAVAQIITFTPLLGMPLITPICVGKMLDD
jgi:hypothetical protein